MTTALTAGGAGDEGDFTLKTSWHLWSPSVLM